jgi:hypothetical protein
VACQAEAKLGMGGNGGGGGRVWVRSGERSGAVWVGRCGALARFVGQPWPAAIRSRARWQRVTRWCGIEDKGH